MNDVISLYRELHGANMHHQMLTAIEALVLEKTCYENELARIAGGDFRDDGTTAVVLASIALRAGPRKPL